MKEDKFISKRGNRFFTESPDTLRNPAKQESGFYVEVNLSANHIRDSVRDLLKHFGIEEKALKIYLREDRDSG